MADVTPQVRCDNCGVEVFKVKNYSTDVWENPSNWGFVRMLGYRALPPIRLTLNDLCGNCLNAAHDAVKKALEGERNVR